MICCCGWHRSHAGRPDAVIVTRGACYLPQHLAPHTTNFVEDARGAGPRTNQDIVGMDLELIAG